MMFVNENGFKTLQFQLESMPKRSKQFRHLNEASEDAKIRRLTLSEEKNARKKSEENLEAIFEQHRIELAEAKAEVSWLLTLGIPSLS